MNMKVKTRILAIAMSVMAMMPTPASAAERNNYFYADVNGDGVVNIADIIIVVDCLMYGGGDGGDMPNPNTNPAYVSSKEYGAVGDGVTDDTQALESLFEAGFRLKKAVYLEPGTYLIRRSLTLKTGMEIYGNNATITRAKTVSSTLTGTADKNQMFIDVDDASQFDVGDQIFIYDEGGVNLCTHAVVLRKEGNRIHFHNVISDQQSDFMGCVRPYAAGTMVTTSFPLLRSWTARYECDGVTVRNLTLDGNRDNSEPVSWANSCLCIDAYRSGGYTDSTGVEYRTAQCNLTARKLTIRNSPGDGISDHGKGGLTVTDCIIENSAMHGIQMESGFAHAMISGNTMTGNGLQGSGVYFSQDVSDVVMDNNVITSFEHGCGVDKATADVRYALIRKNQFTSITGEVFDFTTASATPGGVLQISNNTIRGLRSLLFTGNNLGDLMMAANEVKTITTLPANVMRVVQCGNVILSVNKLPSSAVFSTPVISTGTVNMIEYSNSWN